MKKNTLGKNKSSQTKLAALYNPYLDVLGGGEKHILSILKIFFDQGIKITLFFDQNLEKKIRERFNLDFLSKINWQPNIKNLSFWQKINLLKKYDYFFYVTDGSYFISPAKKNFIFAMVPDKKLYRLNLINRLKLFNYRFISNSSFTSLWLKKWGIKSITIPTYIDDLFFKLNINKKEPIILMVGRFYKQLHSKKQDLAIKLFKKIKQKYLLFKKFKLILVGGLKEDDKDYFNFLIKIIGNNSDILVKPNITFNELIDLYQRSKYFWHFTGFEVDQEKDPEKVEHLGITPLEAAAAGCLVFCHNSGGPKLIFHNKIDGFLFEKEEEIINNMINLEKNPWQTKKIIDRARKMVKENFSYQTFKMRVEKLI